MQEAKNLIEKSVKMWEETISMAEDIGDIYDELSERYNLYRHSRDYPETLVAWEFNIKVYPDIPEEVYEHLDRELFFEEIANVANMFLKDFTDELMQEYRWIKDWTQAGRSGGWLVLFDSELSEYIGPEGIYVIIFSICACNPFPYNVYPFGSEVFEPCSTEEFRESLEKDLELDFGYLKEDYEDMKFIYEEIKKFRKLMLKRKSDLKEIDQKVKKLVRDFETTVADLDFWKDIFDSIEQV